MISGLMTLGGFLVLLGIPVELDASAFIKVPLTIVGGLLTFCGWAVLTSGSSKDFAGFGAFAIIGLSLVALARSAGL